MQQNASKFSINTTSSVQQHPLPLSTTFGCNRMHLSLVSTQHPSCNNALCLFQQPLICFRNETMTGQHKVHSWSYDDLSIAKVGGKFLLCKYKWCQCLEPHWYFNADRAQIVRHEMREVTKPLKAMFAINIRASSCKRQRSVIFVSVDVETENLTSLIIADCGWNKLEKVSNANLEAEEKSFGKLRTT